MMNIKTFLRIPKTLMIKDFAKLGAFHHLRTLRSHIDKCHYWVIIPTDNSITCYFIEIHLSLYYVIS